MRSQKILHIYERGIEKIQEHYSSVLRDFEKDKNHNFRVEIKKLRAFIRLMSLSQSGAKSKIPKLIKKCYHLVGEIRNLQLHKERVNTLCKKLFVDKPAFYIQCLREEERTKKKKTRQAADKISFKDFKNQITNDVPEEVSPENKNDFVKNSISRLARLLALPVYYDETFHTIRKIIKDLLYNYDYLDEQISRLVPSPLNDRDFMESITGTLGNFLDLSLALFFLSPLYLDQIDQEKEKQILNELQEHFGLRKNNVENELVQLLFPLKSRLERF